MKNDTTKQALANALKQLLQKKQITKITINDIAEACGVSRMTFYYHFKDIYDLIEWSCEEDARRAADGNMTYETWEQGFLNIFHVVEENKPFILNVYHYVSQEQIIQYLYKVVYELIKNVVEECAQGMSVRDDDKKFIADFYKFAFVGMMLDWIRQDMKPSPEKLISRLSILIEGDVVRMLEKCRTDKHV